MDTLSQEAALPVSFFPSFKMGSAINKFSLVSENFSFKSNIRFVVNETNICFVIPF